MYIPEHFRVRDHADAVAFMNANPFVILVSGSETGPFASHVPVTVREAGDQLILRGHFAKANSHWRYLEQKPQCLTIFHGPHAYVSPSLYTIRESVPTWVYGAVHVYGKARIFSTEDELQGMLHELINKFEPAYAQQWSGLNEAYRTLKLSQIVGFEITATKIEAKFKLDQNRPKQDQANVLAALEKSQDTTVSGLSCLMREQGVGVSKKKDSE